MPKNEMRWVSVGLIYVYFPFVHDHKNIKHSIKKVVTTTEIKEVKKKAMCRVINRHSFTFLCFKFGGNF